MRLVQKAHQFISTALKDSGCAIDMTCGNGMDSLFFARIVGEKGNVYAFDIQEEAISKTKELLQENHCASQAKLFKACHSQIERYLPQEKKGHVNSIAMNLGYLPKGNHDISTKSKTTIPAILIAYDWMKLGGAMTIIAYRGHKGGKDEAEQVGKLISEKEWKVSIDQGIKKAESPLLYMISKL
jgi:predicted methyltransferase